MYTRISVNLKILVEFTVHKTGQFQGQFQNGFSFFVVLKKLQNLVSTVSFSFKNSGV